MVADAEVILVVDDDAVIRTLVRTGLNRVGRYRVLEATDGLAAKNILSTEDVDVVVTDIQMPQMSGLDLIRWANDTHISPVWIILSAVDTFDAAVDAIQVGAFDFLAKPPALPQLEVTVRNALEHRRLLEERDRLFAALERESAVIRRDLQRAEVIQRALLPAEPPPLARYCVNALYSPGNHVGGDLYNVIRVGAKHLVIYVADATGHGVSSAMLSVLFRRHLVIQDADGEPLAPAAVLKRVNQALTAERVGSGLFLTAAYCVLDVETGEARFAAAGHPPVVWRKASGEVHRITRTGPVLGITAEANYREVSAQIGKDDRLLFFTDGLLQRDEAGQWRAIETSLALTEADGRAVLQSLMDSTQPDNEDRDDMTLLLLQASPGVSHFNNVGAATAEGAVPVAGTAAGREAVVWYGETADESFLQVRGRGTWMDCDAFYDTAHAIAEDLRPVVVDLSTCEYLDSTFLGTIHELVSTDRVRVQGLTPAVRATFEELDMQQVLRSADGPHTPLPNEMQPLNSLSGAMTSSQKRILRAHETLASLSERNREKFRGVVDAMRAM